MAAQAETPRLIESYYGVDELETASPGRRLGGSLLDGFILVFTLYIGWIVWFIIVTPRGQTPGKQLRGIGFPAEPGEIRRKSLGQPTHPEAKAEGDNSMSVKRLRSESVVGPVPQGPRDTVKA